MNRFLTGLTFFMAFFAGCSVVQPNINLERPVPPHQEVEKPKSLSELDPNDGEDEFVLMLGTDDQIFGDFTMDIYFAGLASWAKEASDYLEGDIVVFLSHGADAAGLWICEYGPNNFHSVEFVAKDIRKELGEKNKETPIVLIICNKWGFDLDADDNVWYAKENIFILPDSFFDKESAEERYKELEKAGESAIGSFDKFINNNNL